MVGICQVNALKYSPDAPQHVLRILHAFKHPIRIRMAASNSSQRTLQAALLHAWWPC